MVESKAKVNIMYRGFIINLRVSKDSNGEKSVYTSIDYHVPELKPEYAEKIDKRKTIETQNGDIECMRTYDTIRTREVEKLCENWFYNPKYDDKKDKSILSKWLSIGSSDSNNTSPALSTMIREVMESIQTNIDDYIEAHSLVEISKDEVKHGLEQSLSTPMNDVKVNTPNMNTDTSYDSVRPDISKIENKLENSINCS